MGKYVGPKSDPEGKGHKLLVIDGHIEHLSAEIDEYVDYWITQSYNHSTPDYRPQSGNLKKLIITENLNPCNKRWSFIGSSSVDARR